MSVIPSLASIVAGSAAIKAIIGSNPVRFYPHAHPSFFTGTPVEEAVEAFVNQS